MRAVHFCAVCGILWIGGSNVGEGRFPDLGVKLLVVALVKI
jgi:hypothetical protein